MTSLNEVFKQYFEDGQIIKVKKVWLTDSWSGNLSRSKYFYLSPLDFLETDKFYFFDRREAYLQMNRISSLVSPFFMGGVALFLWWSAWGKTAQSFFLVVIAFLLGFFPYVSNKLINAGLINIIVLKKEWVQEIKKNDESTFLKGTIPPGQNYFLVYLLNREKQSKLSFLDKLFSGLYFGNGNVKEIHFQFSYKDA